MGSKGSNTTTTQTAANPAAMQSYYDLLNRASGVAATPYQAYQGDLTAPINAQQTTGINNINSNAGFAQPYIQQAAGYANNAAQPLSASQIQQYQSPYTQSVVDATSNWFNNQNQQQQQNVLGNAASQGALGGDRVGVAQANLAAQQTASQAPVIAGLYNQGYQQAVGVAQQQQQNQANAAYSLGNLGVSGQNAALSGANAQVGAGSLEQQNQQQQLNALYQQYQIAQAFPYQQTQWLAGVDTGVGSQLGGNSSTTAPAPNQTAQYLGAGLAGASLFLRKGGAVPGFAPGGDVGGMPYSGVAGWIPGSQITHGQGAPRAPGIPVAPNGMAALTSGLNTFAKASNRPDGGSGSSPTDLTASGVSGFSPTYPGATLDPGSFNVSTGLGPLYRDGGRIRGFAPGGDVGSFDDRWMPAVDAVADGTFDPQGLNGRSDNYNITPTVSDAGVVPMPRSRSDNAPQIAGFSPADTAANARDDAIADASDGTDQPALGFAPDQQPLDQLPGGEGALPFADIPNAPSAATPQAGVAARPSTPTDGGIGLGLLPNNLRMPLLAAGLGMLASRSPNLGNAIGEGGMAGVNTYAQQKQQEQQHAEKKQTIEQQNRKIDLEAKRLDQAAEMSRKTLALHTQTAADTANYHQGLLSRENLKPVGTNEDGFPVYLDNRTGKEIVGTQKLQGKENLKPTGSSTDDGHPIMYDTRKPGAAFDGITGKPLTGDEKIISGKQPEPSFTGDELKTMARQYNAGDKSVLVNLGRGTQGASDIRALRKAIVADMNEKGITPEQQAVRMAEFQGMTAGQRSLGTMEAKMGAAGFEAEGAIKLARGIIDKVPRTSFLPLNQLIQGYQKQTLDPNQAELLTRIQGVRNTYAAVMNRGANVTTDSARHRADEMLNSAGDAKSLNRVMDTMLSEIDMARNSPERMRQFYSQKYGNNATEGGQSSAAPVAAPSPQDKQALDWANANPSDPRAAAIKKRLGAP